MEAIFDKQQISVAVDAVVFGYSDKKLYVLLIQQKYGSQKGKWALPGGFVKDQESLDQAVKRELSEETSVSISYLEQLYTFGDINRDPRARVITVAYLGLVNPNDFSLKAYTDAMSVAWYHIDDKLPDLAFDHNIILEKALNRLRRKLYYEPIGFKLLDKYFPFSDLEFLYQTILGRSIDRRNFRKKIMSLGFVELTDQVYKPQTGRPAKLYTFDKIAYKALKNQNYYLDLRFV